MLQEINLMLIKTLAGFFLSVFLLFVSGCQGIDSIRSKNHSSGKATQTLEFPSSYLGILPCANCSGIRYTLNLWPDKAFFLRMTYLGKGQGEGDSFYDIGQWRIDDEILTLMGGKEASQMFAIKDADTLRKLDTEGKEIQSRLNYDLTRSERFEPLEPQLPMRGMYSYMADAGMFQECLTGWRLPVAQIGDNAALEAAYSKARREPGEALLVNLEGTIAIRPKTEGEGTQPTLIVVHFNKIWPDETCGPGYSTTKLENTYWKLVRLGNEPVTVGAGEKEPYMTLMHQGERVQGFAGCNRMMGSYELNGENLKFGRMASTRMACQNGMELESAFMQALESTVKWKIAGEYLELSDLKGALVARFESRYLRAGSAAGSSRNE
jgi:copper homeostasis protein (lipoprotein)